MNAIPRFESLIQRYNNFPDYKAIDNSLEVILKNVFYGVQFYKETQPYCWVYIIGFSMAYKFSLKPFCASWDTSIKLLPSFNFLESWKEK